MTRKMTGWVSGACFALSLASACEQKKSEGLAPVASALSSARPAREKAAAFVVDSASSKVSFLMEAPIEKIYGEAPASVDGEIYLDVEDVTKSTGLVRVDLEKLTLYQQARKDEKSTFGERSKSDKQNEHARTWLEVSPDAPEDVRRLNRYAEFKIMKIEDASLRNLGAQATRERTLTATLVGDFRLHARKTEKKARVEIRVTYAGDRAESVHVKTLEPIKIGLEEHDVRPREAFGKLAQRTLDALGSKVAQVAPIEIEFQARAK